MSDYNLQQEVSDKYSLRGRVFHKIREDILNGKYKQNEELREATIGAELGVSRTPVREAFRQLELEGLLKMIPNYRKGCTGYLCDPFHAGRIMCQMGNGKDHTGAAQRNGRKCISVRVP